MEQWDFILKVLAGVGIITGITTGAVIWIGKWMLAQHQERLQVSLDTGLNRACNTFADKLEIHSLQSKLSISEVAGNVRSLDHQVKEVLAYVKNVDTDHVKTQQQVAQLNDRTTRLETLFEVRENH